MDKKLCAFKCSRFEAYLDKHFYKLFPQKKTYVLVLIRRLLAWHFNEYPQNIFSRRNKKDVNKF